MESVDHGVHRPIQPSAKKVRVPQPSEEHCCSANGAVEELCDSEPYALASMNFNE